MILYFPQEVIPRLKGLAPSNANHNNLTEATESILNLEFMAYETTRLADFQKEKGLKFVKLYLEIRVVTFSH